MTSDCKRQPHGDPWYKHYYNECRSKSDRNEVIDGDISKESALDISNVEDEWDSDVSKEFLLDIPNAEYNWAACKHVILFMCRLEDNIQAFLLLRAAGKGLVGCFERIGVAWVEEGYLLDVGEEGWTREPLA
jgi:hypothetical protein